MLSRVADALFWIASQPKPITATDVRISRDAMLGADGAGLDIALAQALPAPLVASRTGGRIALLLPLSGPAAGQAATVRDGFLSAYYQLPEATRPVCHGRPGRPAPRRTMAIDPDRAISDAHVRFGQPNACSTQRDPFVEPLAGI